MVKNSFNPYSTGFSSFIHPETPFSHTPFRKFQSLFYWILFFYHFHFHLPVQYFQQFQSLFYWILFFYLKFREHLPFLYLVSILILLDSLLLSNVDGNIVRSVKVVFQSLFYWILFFYIIWMECLLMLLKVSILILLDSLLL